MSDPHQPCHSPTHGASNRPGVNVSVREDQEPTVNRNLESLLGRLTAAVMILDRASCVTYLSHQADPLLASTRAALLGKTFWEVFPEVVDSPFFRKYHDALRASLAVHAEEYYPPFSAHVTANSATEACGADDFLAKPFRIKELLAIVARRINPIRNGTDVRCRLSQRQG